MNSNNEKGQKTGGIGGHKPRTRKEFLGAAVVAGGAVYLDPGAAMAQATRPNVTLPGVTATTPIAKIVNVGNAVPATLTPRDLAALASLGSSSVSEVARAYPDLKFSQLRSILDATIKDEGADARVFQPAGGGAVGMIPACCCCCCCHHWNLGKKSSL